MSVSPDPTALAIPDPALFNNFNVSVAMLYSYELTHVCETSVDRIDN